MKLSIIGMGQVGTALAYGIVLKELVNELVLVHRRPEIATANALDLEHSLLFSNRRMNIYAGNLEKTSDSEIIIITASKPWRDNFKDRLDAARDNTELFAEMVPKLAALSPQAKLVIITNPVDILTYHAIQLSGFPANRVMGTGTLIDSARLRNLLAQDIGIHPADLRAYILGEHGNSQFPVYSTAQAGGMSIDWNEKRRQMGRDAAKAGVEVFKGKGNTNFAIASAALYLINSIINDSRHTMPVSIYAGDSYNLGDLCISLPAVIGSNGVEKILTPSLNEDEMQRLNASATTLQQIIRETRSVYHASE